MFEAERPAAVGRFCHATVYEREVCKNGQYRGWKNADKNREKSFV